MDIQVGDFVAWFDGERWYPGKVQEIKGTKAYVRFSRGYATWIEMSELEVG